MTPISTTPKDGRRDPRVNPIPGDELVGGKSIRYVGRVFDNGEVGFTYWPRAASRRGTGNDCVTSINKWREWGKNAEVIERATEQRGDGVKG